LLLLKDLDQLGPKPMSPANNVTAITLDPLDVGFEKSEDIQPLISASSLTSDGNSPPSPSRHEFGTRGEASQSKVTRQGQTVTDQEIKAKRREASRRCRLRKKEKNQEMKQRVAELLKENWDLKQKLHQLATERRP